MKIEDLFEKRERAVFQLITLLQEQPANHFVKDLSEQLGISRTTLLRYIDSFQQEAVEEKLGVTLSVQGEQIFYHRQPDLTQQVYLRFLARSSLKYQILSYIFDKDEFTIQKLSQYLLISEASLNRQLSALNQLLEEFGLVIRNGRLKGSELQIRHFYFLLFWYLGGSAQDDFSQLKTYQEASLRVFERLSDGKFSPRQADQLLLWLVIGQKRMRLSGLDFEPLYQNMKPYQTHKFYDRLRQVAFTLYDQTAGGVKEGEIMSHFAFLFFRFIMGAPQVEQMLAFGGPIREATTLGLSYLREVTPQHLLLNEEAMYRLNQLLGQLYFFRGQLVVDGHSLPFKGLPSRFRKLSRQVFEQVTQEVYQQPQALSQDFADSICHSLEKLFYYLTLETPSYVQIGVVLTTDKVSAKPMLAHLRQELEQNRYIALEEWQSDKTYDLIISDYRPVDQTPTYIIAGYLTKGDIVALKNVIKQLNKG